MALLVLFAFALFHAMGAWPACTVRLQVGKASEEMALERYVAGVVAAEMPASWPMAALQALAVAARTYAAYHHFHLVAGPKEQAFRDPALLPPWAAARVEAAVRATEGLVVLWRGRPALAAYSADAGPYTESSQSAFGTSLPYLAIHPDPYGVGAPVHVRRLRIPLGRWRRLFGTMRPRLEADRAGYVVRLGRLPGSVAASLLSLPSAHFRYQVGGGAVWLTVFGAGHGVGLDEWGARRMAEEGRDFGAILRFYYPGTELGRLRGCSAP